MFVSIGRNVGTEPLSPQGWAASDDADIAREQANDSEGTATR